MKGITCFEEENVDFIVVDGDNIYRMSVAFRLCYQKAGSFRLITINPYHSSALILNQVETSPPKSRIYQ